VENIARAESVGCVDLGDLDLKAPSALIAENRTRAASEGD